MVCKSKISINNCSEFTPDDTQNREELSSQIAQSESFPEEMRQPTSIAEILGSKILQN